MMILLLLFRFSIFSIAFFWGESEMSATPCLLVAIISQVLHDFDTYWLVSAYSSCFIFCTCYTYLCCWHLWSDYPILWVCLRWYIDYDVDAFHFILMVFAWVWVVLGSMLHKPMGHAQFSLESKNYFKLFIFEK